MHPSGKAFRVIKSSEHTESPYMTTIQAHDALVSYFHATEVSSDKLGPDNRSFRLHFDDNSGISQALRLIKDNTPKALHMIYRGDQQNLYKCLPSSAFNAVSMVHFATGWNLTSGSNFLKWAKNEVLDLENVSRIFSLPYVPFVPVKYLNEEKIARAKLLECISGISMLDQTIKETKDKLLANTLGAIARHFLSCLKDAALKWLTTKFVVRQIVLQFSSASGAIDLLRSDVWEASVFELKTVTEIQKKNTQNLTFKELLQLHESTNESYRNSPKWCDPSNRTKQDRCKSPIKKYSRPAYQTNYKSFSRSQNSRNYRNKPSSNYKREQSFNYKKQPNNSSNNLRTEPQQTQQMFQKKSSSKNFQASKKPQSSFRGPKQF